MGVGWERVNLHLTAVPEGVGEKNTEPKGSDLSERFGFLLPPAAPSQI